MERMKWIDGIKGIACVGIFYHHFLLRYAPESYYGESAGNSAFCIYLSESPLGFLINGNFWVFLFLLISGYVVCRRVVNTKYEEIPVFAVSRYLKLAMPIFICETFYYVFYKLKIGGGGQLFTEEDQIHSFLIVPENAFIKVLFFGDTTFAGAFWMMNIIFIGGLFVIAISAVGKKNKRLLMWIFMIVSAAMLFRHSYYYSIVYFGAFLYIFLDSFKGTCPAFLKAAGLVLGVFFGGYPTGVVPQRGVYKYITFSFFNENAAVWHWLAAILIFVSVFYCKRMKDILEIKSIQWIGGISYIFFVFHNFMRKIFDPLYTLVLNHWEHQALAIIVDSSVVIIVLFVFSELYMHTFGIWASRVIKWLLDYVRAFVVWVSKTVRKLRKAL